MSYGDSMFNILRNYQTVFQSGHMLHSHQQHVRIPISLHSHQHLLLSRFFIIAVLLGVKWRLILVLICIFQMTNDVEHLFMCLLAIHRFSLEKCLFRSFAHFSIGLFVFYYWVKRTIHIFWILIPTQIHDTQRFFSTLWVVFSLSWWCLLK